MAMMHDGLISYYERIFAFKQFHNWSVDEIGEFMPWELEVMQALLANYLEQQELKRKQQQATMNSMR